MSEVVLAEEGTCSTVRVRALRDLNPAVEPNEHGQRCATLFLRNYVYDGEGNLARHYDTNLDGEPYTPAAIVDCPDGLVPSLAELVWPQANVIADPEGQAGHDFIYILTNPRTGEEARIRFNTVQAPYTSPGHPCEAWQPGNNVAVNAPIGNPNPDSRFTFRLDEAARRMTSLRLDFIDLDPWEACGASTQCPTMSSSSKAPAPGCREATR